MRKINVLHSDVEPMGQQANAVSIELRLMLLFHYKVSILVVV